MKTEQRVNEEASYEKATVRKQKFRVIVYNFKRKGNNNLRWQERIKRIPNVLKRTFERSSEQGRRANALALGADERRDKLR